MRVHGDADVVEVVVEATQRVGDPPVGAAAPTVPVQHRDLVGHLVADQRQRVVVQVGQPDRFERQLDDRARCGQANQGFAGAWRKVDCD